jgi:LysM domain
MSVMTAGEQKRRAAAARGRRAVTAVPGQPNVMAGPWPGAGKPRRRMVHGTPGRTEAALIPAARAATAARPAARAVTAERPATRPPATAVPLGRSPAAGPAAARSRIVRTRARLTRRGRIVVAALITATVVLVAALAWLAGTARADAAGRGVPARAVYHSLRSVTVLPGESLWSIATQYEPASDPRGVIQEIIDLNALSGTSVQPGEHLWLPRG